MTGPVPPEATGTCFPDALRLACFGGLDVPEEHVRLVHGRVYGRGEAEGWRFSHAWVETGGLVFDPSGEIVPLAAYYVIGRVIDVHRYTVPEARMLALLSEHCGPWDPAIMADPVFEGASK